MSDLTALLDKEADAEITAILSEARERASEVIAAAQAEAETLLASRERTARTQYDAALVRARSAAQLESAAVLLRGQHDAIEAVFSAVETELEKRAGSSEYVADLAKLLEEALAAGGENAQALRVLVNPADVQVAEAVAAKLGADTPVEADETVHGGVHVDFGESGLTIENTLGGRLAAAREELSSEVAKALSGSDG